MTSGKIAVGSCGLLCTAFCPSVTGPKFWLDKKSLDQNSEKSLDQNSDSMMITANCYSGVKSISHVTGRCALFNVKLHFLQDLNQFTKTLIRNQDI